MRILGTRFVALRWLIAAAAIALASCGGGRGSDTAGGAVTFQEGNTPSTTPASVQQLANAFAATLSGAQEVPVRVTSALGSGVIVVNPTTLEMVATLTTTGITGTAANIHQAATGANGPIVIPLTETSTGSGTWTARATLTEAQFTTLRASGLYFNVQSARFPDGEIRGQITPQELTGGTAPTGTGTNTQVTPLTTYLSALRGTQVVPATPSTGLGAGAILTSPFTREIIAAVATSGVAGTTAHIHQGALGINGPILVPLGEVSPGSGVWTGRATLTDAQYNALFAGNLYFNVRSASYPAGEIRGQIVIQRQTIANSIGSSTDTTGTGTSTGTGTGSETGSGSAGTGTDTTTGPPTGTLGGTGTDTTGTSLTPVPGATTTGTTTGAMTNPGVITPVPTGDTTFGIGI
ncbi:hypothetical protein GCM10027343_41930 [Noviherbaspirillum agri]